MSASGEFLPLSLSLSRIKATPGDDRIDIEAIIKCVSKAVRAGRPDVAATLARFAASVVRDRSGARP